MADWKHYMSTHFSSCTLLARARDHHRERDVRIYVIPGVGDSVGISDGTDDWIAPVSADCFSVNVKRLLEDLHAGKGIPAAALAGYTRRVRRVPIGETHVEGERRASFSASTPSIQNMPRRPRARPIEQSDPSPAITPRRRRAEPL